MKMVVKDLWWDEDGTLHMKVNDGKRYAFKDARVVSYTPGEVVSDPPGTIEVQKVKFVEFKEES
jgi:hypothetical protein